MVDQDFAHLANTLLKDEESARDSRLLVTLPDIHRCKKNFSHRLSIKPFLIWLLITPPHLKHVATLHCKLLLMACFADINDSQGSVATYARCSGTFNIHLTMSLPRNLPVIKFF